MRSLTSALAVPRPVQRGAALLAALLLGIMALLIGAPTAPAAAAEGDVKIDKIEIQYEGDEGVVEDWRYQRVDVEWSVDGTATTPVSVTIDLPENFRGRAETFPVYGPDQQRAGECVVTTTQITCTIDDAFIEENPEGVSGDFFFEARTELDNREDITQTIDIGGFENEVVVTPSRNWCVEDCDFGGTGQGKWGSYNANDDTIVWTVRVPAPAEGIAPGQEITVTDLLDAGAYELVDDGIYPRVEEAGQLRYDRWGHEQIAGWQTRADGVEWSADKLTATFESRDGHGSDWNNYDEIQPPAQGAQRGTDGAFYQVQWKVKALTGGELRPNGDRVFRNAAEWSIGDEQRSEVTGSTTRVHRGGNVVGTNYGRFQLTESCRV